MSGRARQRCRATRIRAGGPRHPPPRCRCPSTTSGASARRCCRSCCGWRRCAASRACSRCSCSTTSASSALCTPRCCSSWPCTASSALTLAWQRHPALDPVRVSGHRAAVRPGRPVRRPPAPARARRRSPRRCSRRRVIALVFALADGQHFSSYYIFYGSLVFGTIYIARAARPAHARHRLAARPGRLPPARGDRRLRARRSRRSRTRWPDALAHAASTSSATSR